jgi:eukaryotic-like serine/threonine-protein kinase
MICPACNAVNATETEECFGCGRALFALTQGRVLAQRYEIRRPIGQGGMGKVYEAYDRVLDERVAIKVLRPQFAREPDMARRFLSEIRLARRITHPHVCRLHEYGESEGIRYLCMELVDGVNLKDVLRSRRLGTEDAYDVSMAAAEGLAAVHAQGVIHRDFKTANIMVDGRGHVKVMDFGIAKEVGSETTGVSLAGHVLGTPEYMSPEHAQGGTVDFRSDLYALGCVIFEVFAGRALFQGATPIDTLRRHLHEPLVFTGDTGPLVPEPLVPVLTRALAKKPDDRYPSVAELVEDMRSARATSALHAVLGDDDPFADLLAMAPPTFVAAPAPSASEPEARKATRTLPTERPGPRPLPVAATKWRRVGAAALVTLVAAASLAWWRASAPEPVASAPAITFPNAPPSTVITLAPAPPSSTLAAVPATTLTARLASRPPRAERSPALAVEDAEPSRPPSTPATVPEPSPRPVLVAESPSTAPRIATPAAEVTQELGWFNLLVVPASEVTIDGRTIGIVSKHALQLPAGAYDVRVDNPDYLPYNRRVTVRSGTTSELVVDLKEKGVRKKP